MTAAVIILCIAALVILLLVIPLRIELRGSVHNRLELKLRFEYLFGLVSWESGDVKSVKPESRVGPDAADDYGWLPRLYNVAQTEGLWDRSWKLARSLWGRVKVEKIDVDLAVSLGDDYYTGTVAGFLIPICLFINSQFATDINLKPAFEEDLLIEGHINADWQVVLAGIILPCLAFMISTPFRQAYHTYHA